MNKLGLVLGTLVSLSSFTAFAAPTTWDIDPAHSSAGFSVRHMMVSTVRGDFGKLTGTVTIEGTDWKTATVNASVDVSTINTREPKRDGHLKSPDFFDVAKYPTMTFKSTKVDVVAGGAVKLMGNLTIHGVTKPVTFDVQPVSKEYKHPSGQIVIGTSATTKLNRKDFGLTWNKPLESAGGVMVGDEINVTLDLELDKKMAAGGRTVPPPAKK
ncbi:MAG: YceI family protein [Polyangia bacterium]